jgi:hypothetical protein
MTDLSRRDVHRLFAAAIGAAAIPSGAAAAAVPVDVQSANKGSIAMTTDLRELTADHFEALVGETFVVDGQPTRLRAVRRGPAGVGRFRQQFALSFATPAGMTIRSDVVPVSHPAIGRHDLLVTQVIDHTEPTALEICFA